MKNRRLEDFKIGMSYDELEFELTCLRTENTNKIEFVIYKFDGLIINFKSQALELYFNADVLMKTSLVKHS